MPVTFTKKPKASKTTEFPPLVLGHAPREETQLVTWLDPSNKTTRTPIGWITDGSPSMTGFTDVQLQSAVSMVGELVQLPATSRSGMRTVVQIGTPPVATGFSEIAKFRVPDLHVACTTPLHAALDQMTHDLGALFSDFRARGIERTESVVIITTDGYANGATEEQINESIRKFLELGKKWAVTNLVVGVGSQLNVPLLKALANSVPPLRIDELNAACLMPFIQKIAERMSQSRRGQKLELELPEGMEPIE